MSQNKKKQLEVDIQQMREAIGSGQLTPQMILKVQESIEKANKELDSINSKPVKKVNLTELLNTNFGKQSFDTTADFSKEKKNLRQLLKDNDLEYDEAAKSWISDNFKLKKSKPAPKVKVPEKAQVYTEKDADNLVNDLLGKNSGKKAKSAPKVVAKTKKTAPLKKPVFSWLSATKRDVVPIYAKHRMFAIKLEADTIVALKGTDGKSVRVTAAKGDSLIFDDKKHLVYVADKDWMKGRFTYAKPAAKVVAKPAAKVVVKPAKKKAPKKRAVCTMSNANTGKKIAKILDFFIDHAHDWKEKKTGLKFLRVLKTKGEKSSVVIHVQDWRGAVNSAAAAMAKVTKYYMLCMDTFKLTRVKPPKIGSYNIVVTEKQAKEIYTTNGEEVYHVCVKTYRELLKCSFEGTCTPKQKGKWKDLYYECGDLVKKLDVGRAGGAAYYDLVRERRNKTKEKHSVAMIKVSEQLRKKNEMK